MFVDGVPCHFSSEGDASEVAKWIPYAKRLFQQVRQQPGVAQKHQFPADGVKIYVMKATSGKQTIGHIRVEVTNDNPFVNGLASLHLQWQDGKMVVDRTNGVQSIQLKGNSTCSSEKLQLEWLNNPKIKKPFMRTSYNSKYGSYSYESNGIASVGYTGDLYSPELNNSPLYKMPGKYSGEMRKCVQAVLGMGKGVGVEFGFYRTHGIFTNSNAKKYVVEIGTRGILATELRCIYLNDIELSEYKTEIGSTNYDLHYKLASNSLDVFPNSDTELESQITSGKIARLAPASAMVEFYNNSPYFLDCGWAFSYSGQEIQNTCWSNKPDDMPRWCYGYRYKIRLTTDNTTGFPKLVDINIVDEGYLHGSVVSWWVPKNYTTLDHFDIWRQNIYGAPPTDKKHGCTFYVYYDGDDEKVCGFLPDREIVTTSRSDSVNTDVVDGISIDDPPYDKVNGSTSEYLQQEVYIDSPVGYPTLRYTGTFATYISSVEREGPTYFWVNGEYFFSSPNEGLGKATKEVFIGASDVGQRNHTVGVIPAFDRESFLLYKSESYVTPSGCTYGSSTGFTGFTHGGWSAPRVIRASGTFNWAQLVNPDGSPAPFFPSESLGIATDLSNGGYDAVMYPLPSAISTDPVGTWDAMVADSSYVSTGTPLGLLTEDRVTGFVSSLSTYSSGNGASTVDTTGTDSLLGDLTFLNIASSEGFESLWYQSIPDAFTGGRSISKQDNGVTTSTMLTIGSVPTNYSEAINDTSRIKYYFGAP